MTTLKAKEVHDLMTLLENQMIDCLNGSNESLNNRSKFEKQNDQIEIKINKFELTDQDVYLELKLRHLRMKLAFEREDPNSRICENLKNLIEDYEKRLTFSEKPSCKDISFSEIAFNDEDAKDVKTNKRFPKEIIDWLLESNFLSQEVYQLTIKHCEILSTKINNINSFDKYDRLVVENQYLFELFNQIFQNHSESNQTLKTKLKHLIVYLVDLNNNMTQEFIENIIKLYKNCSNVKKGSRDLQYDKPSIALYNEDSMKSSRYLQKRYRVLSHRFHPDKNNSKNAAEFFDIIKKCKDYLHQKIYDKEINLMSDEPKMRAYEQKANEFCNISIDFQKIANKKKNLRVLNNSNVPNYTKEELFKKVSYFANLSVTEYMNACKLADKLELVEDQLLYRHNMGIAFYIAEKLIEAQLIVISEIFLIMKIEKTGKTVSSKSRNDLKKLVEKIEKKLVGAVNNNENLTDNQFDTRWASDALQLVEYTEIDSELLEEKLSSSLMLLMEKDRYELQIALTQIDSNIKAIESSIEITKFVSCSVGVASLGLAGLQGLELYSIYTGAVVASSMLGPAAVIICSGLTFIGSILGSGYLINKRYEAFKNEESKKQACETLNQIFNKAFEFYKEAKYEEFLKELAKDFSPGKNLIKFNENVVKIDPEVVCQTLLSFFFPPDGIAYLLNLIATVLASGKIKSRPRYDQTSYQCQAKELFNFVANDKDDFNLFKNCADIEKEERRNRLKFIKSVLGIDKNTFLKLSENQLLYKKLMEAQFVAKINLIFLTIIMKGTKKEAVDELETQRKELKAFLREKQHFIEIAALSCLELIEFLFIVLNIPLFENGEEDKYELES